MRRAGSNAAGNGGPSEPTAHASTHLSGGADPIAAATTSAAGLVQLATSGSATAGRAVAATDSRLSDARTPTSHQSSHRVGGDDALPAASTSVAGLVQLGGEVGKFLSSKGPEATYTAPALEPMTAWELDWTAQSSQTINSDTTWNIGGASWTAYNTANASSFAVTSGTGLVITAASGVSRTWTTTRTAPALAIALASLVSTAVTTMAPVTLWFSVSAWTAAVASNTLILGVWAPSSSYTELVCAGGVTNDSGTTRTYIQRTATFTANSAQSASSSFTLAVRILPGGTVDVWMGAAYTGGAWPALTAMTQVGSDNQPGAASINSTAQVLRSGSTMVVAAATRTASASNPSLTLARSRITYG